MLVERSQLSASIYSGSGIDRLLVNKSDDILLKLIDAGNSTVRPSCELVFKGTYTNKTIQGAKLEACVEIDGHYLLFVTDDIPYEEALYLYLLDADFKMLDSASLGAPYSTGYLTDLNLQPPTSVGFRFIGDTDWTVEVLKIAQWRAPFLCDPKGVLHKFGFKRHFYLRGNPL